MPSKAVRQEEDQATQATPPIGGPCDKLIDDHLACVDKVAELSFPRDQRFGIVEAVAVVEPKHARFGERAVNDLDRPLILRQECERTVDVPVHDVVQHRVPLAERSALRVLTAESHPVAFGRQGRKGERFARGPIEVPLAPPPSPAVARCRAATFCADGIPRERV